MSDSDWIDAGETGPDGSEGPLNPTVGGLVILALLAIAIIYVLESSGIIDWF